MIGRRRLSTDQSGAALVEFALVAPVLLFMLLGLFETAWGLYIQSQLQGAVQSAARAATIENANASQAEIDARVTQAVRDVIPSPTLTFNRRAYSNFSDAGQAEDYTDVNKDGVCNDGEPFEDANGNGVWDLDKGVAGFGGARDVVLYDVTVTYQRPFGFGRWIGLPNTVTTQATTILRNQPYADKVTHATTGNCT